MRLNQLKRKSISTHSQKISPPKADPLPGTLNVPPAEKNQLKSLLALKKFLLFLGVLTVFFGFLAVFAGALPNDKEKSNLQASLFSAITKFMSSVIFASEPETPAASEQQASLLAVDSLSASNAVLGQGGGETSEDETLIDYSIIQDSALAANSAPIIEENGDITTYEVKEGDTPSGIAAKFNISVNTLLWANDIKNPNLIRAGDNLIILPISGVKHQVVKGDTLASIAKKYKGDAAEIIDFNDLTDEKSVKVGDVLIIPNGIIPTPPKASPQYAVKNKRYASLPDLSGYFIRPTVGRISQGFHGKNGVDIANPLGTPIYAAAPGAVIVSDGVGYNGGFGKYIVINHSNGTQTLYAHASRLLVSAGAQVNRGDLIAYMGSTGRSTGSHLHFEVHGARNPLLKY